MEFRLASPADADALVHLNTAINEVEDVSPEDVRRSLRTGAEVVLIAEADGVPIGFCCAQVHFSFCYPAPVAEVTEMYVSPAHRGQGCAGALLSRLEALLREKHGVDEMHLLTGMTNHPAQAAYKKAGYIVKNEIYMTKEVRPKR